MFKCCLFDLENKSTNFFFFCNKKLNGSRHLSDEDVFLLKSHKEYMFWFYILNIIWKLQYILHYLVQHLHYLITRHSVSLTLIKEVRNIQLSRNQHYFSMCNKIFLYLTMVEQKWSQILVDVANFLFFISSLGILYEMYLLLKI